ncbi:MAG: type IV secretory system conjugative DNA transfer family protein [Bacilli bacterium]
MKLKFRIKKTDFIAFGVFGMFLFLAIGLGLLNIMSFGSTGELHGLNPLPIFTIKYFFSTLIITLIVLGAIISGISSKIFEREKGVGFQVNTKQEKNYVRWLEDKEMKTDLKVVRPAGSISQYAGIPLINNGKKLWVDDGEFHNLIIGSTGSGKTEMIVQPLVKVLAKKGESMIITDPKGEIYMNNANELKEKGYNVILINIREPQRGNCWNPLTLPYQLYKEGNIDKAIELVDDLALNILYDESTKGQDPFWERSSADYFSGCVLGLFDDAKEEEINLNSISMMTTVGEDKIGSSTFIKEYFNKKPQTSTAYSSSKSTIDAPVETKGGILAVFRQKLRLFSSRKNLAEMLSHSDFDMKDIGKKKTAVFIVVHDEKKTYHSLITIFVKQCYESLIDVAQENGGRLLYRTNFILDEFANMPALKDATTMVTAARSRKIRFNFIIQNFAQLNAVYGKDQADTIKGNCGNIIYLISTELTALEEISKLCGEVKSKEKDKTVSIPLVTISDLQRLKRWSIIVLRSRKMPFKTTLTPNFKLEKNNAWGKKYEKANFPTREPKEIEIFDVKKFVEKQRSESIAKALEQMNNNNDSSSSIPKSMTPLFNSQLNNEFDYEEIAKRIDARIAELEEEEEGYNKEAKNKQNNNQPVDQNNGQQSIKIAGLTSSLINDKSEIKNQPTHEITDDQLFDDFFTDDEE